MTPPIQLISTDFDGTIFAEFENPPIPKRLIDLIRNLQARGAKWVINTGRDMSSLMEALARAHIGIQPDYLILVEREIQQHDGVRYVSMEPWNSECTRAHERLFTRVRTDLPRLTEWINARYRATVYEDPYSPFCLIAGNNDDAEVIHKFLDAYCRGIPELTIVRNDVYARFSHAGYNKGTALTELARQMGIGPEQIFAVGDHFNDLPMLSRQHAHFLAAPQNAIDEVKQAVKDQKGYICGYSHGDGVAEALNFYLANGNGRVD